MQTTADQRKDQRLHIQHVLLSLQPGGLENGVVNVINRLDRSRFRSSVCCIKQAGEFASRINAPDVQIHEMGWQGGTDWRLILRMAKVFRETKTQIVHTRNAEPFFYGCLAALLAGVPHIVHSEHGRTFNDRAIRFTAQRWLTRKVDAVFAVNEQLKHDLVRHIGIPEQRIEVLYNGVDLARFGQGSRTEARSLMGLGPHEFTIGSVGRLVPVKNYGLLIKSLACPELAQVRLVLIGEGPQRGELSTVATMHGVQDRVLFMGHREDVSRLLPALDAFVLPSISEGMSNTLLEAMACGVPPVVSGVGGNTEIVRDGRDGLVFASEDLAGLRAHLVSLSQDDALRRQLADAARLRVVNSFGIDAMIGRYEALYGRYV